jgi:hypothetical protein
MKLTLKKLSAIQSALNAALAGAGFDGGDFDGQDPTDFENALAWVEAEIEKRKSGRKA